MWIGKRYAVRQDLWCCARQLDLVRQERGPIGGAETCVSLPLGE